MKRKCDCCGNKISFKNDGLFLREFLTNKEMKKLSVTNLCVTCKKELMFANLIEII